MKPEYTQAVNVHFVVKLYVLLLVFIVYPIVLRRLVAHSDPNHINGLFPVSGGSEVSQFQSPVLRKKQVARVEIFVDDFHLVYVVNS